MTVILGNNEYCMTTGTGLWSRKRHHVRIKKIFIGLKDPDSPAPDEQLVDVFFDKKDWDIDRDGLIYTDPGFIKDLSKLMRKLDLPHDVDYTEQGMQGRDYVSCIVGGKW